MLKPLRTEKKRGQKHANFRHGNVEKSVITYFVLDCPDFLPFVYVDLFLSYQRQKKP